MRQYFGISITLWLIIANAAVFLMVNAVPDLRPLLALQGYAILHGSYLWTLITSMFTHFDVLHIMFNMLALFFIGQYVEEILGAKRFLLTYFAGGVMGGLFFILWDIIILGHHATAVGASGAIFGIFAALAVLRPNQRVFLFPFPVPITLPVAVVIAFFAAMFIYGGFTSVANSAHLGGIVGGAICGYYFRKRIGTAYGYDPYGDYY